jgi:hypothetical protein
MEREKQLWFLLPPLASFLIENKRKFCPVLFNEILLSFQGSLLLPP